MHAPGTVAEAPSQLPAQSPASVIPGCKEGVYGREGKSPGWEGWVMPASKGSQKGQRGYSLKFWEWKGRWASSGHAYHRPGQPPCKQPKAGRDWKGFRDGLSLESDKARSKAFSFNWYRECFLCRKKQLICVNGWLYETSNYCLKQDYLYGWSTLDYFSVDILAYLNIFLRKNTKHLSPFNWIFIVHNEKFITFSKPLDNLLNYLWWFNHKWTKENTHILEHRLHRGLHVLLEW